VSLTVLLMLVGFKFSTLKHLPVLAYQTMIDNFGMLGVLTAALVVASNIVHVLLSKAGLHLGFWPFVCLNLLFISIRGGYLLRQCRKYLKNRAGHVLFEYPVDTMVQFKYKRDGDATYHPDFLGHNRKGENIRDPWNEVFEGTRVFHASRAYGTVVQIDMDDQRHKPYHIRFDNGEEHHYSESSLTSGKFFLCDVDEDEPVALVKNEGFGGKLKQRRMNAINS